MLIRDWFENVKCTRQSTAGYHEPASIGSLSLRYSRSLSLFFSRHLTLRSFAFLFLSSTSSTDIYGIFFIAPAAFRSARSRLVSSCLEEAPGTRNVSISVTIDGVPSRVSSPDFGGRGSTYVRKPVLLVLVTEYRVFSRHQQYRFQLSKNTPTAMLSLATRVC